MGMISEDVVKLKKEQYLKDLDSLELAILATNQHEIVKETAIITIKSAKSLFELSFRD